MEKMKMHSPDLTQANIDKLAELFPNCVTEAQDSESNLKRAIDFDQLRQELSDHVVEGPRERYQLNWPGKREALLAANAPIAKTLRPCRNESVDFDTTRNLFIEGDNLEALKLLQETYLNKVKMIYIDPPYNTGKDFLYEDDFSSDLAQYLVQSGQTDDAGIRLKVNYESNGRFHSDWLSMVYARLRFARTLLSDEGVIFISIDEGEAANLKKICGEVFGEQSFLAAITWKKRSSPDARATIGSVHDTILCYVKNGDAPKNAVFKMPLSEQRRSAFTNPDNDPRGPWASVDMTGMIGRATKDQFFDVTLPSGRTVGPPDGRSWGLAESTFKKLHDDNRIWFGKTGDNVPRIKNFLAESEGQVVPTFWDLAECGSNDEASQELTELFSTPKIFDTPKPTRLIDRMLRIATRPDTGDIVLDFFAGSASTAHAVMKVNSDDGGNRRYIAVQLPEPCDADSVAGKFGFKNIAEISKDRIRRAGKQIEGTGGLDVHAVDFGFRVLAVDSSNMKEVYYTPDAVTQEGLFGQIDNIKEDRTDEDLLFQLLLDWGVDLSLPIRLETIADKRVFFVDEDALAACFEMGVDEEFVKKLAERKPLRVVFRDSGYGNDSTKINVEQIFKLISPTTEVKTI